MTNTIPAPIHALLLLFVWTVIGARWIMLRYNMYDLRLTHSLTFACLALTLKDPTVASFVVPELGSTLTRTLVHVLILWAIAALIGVYNAWDPAESPWKQPVMYAVATCLGVALVLLSAPARQLGVTVEQAGGWRAIAYFGLYALLNVYGLGSITLDYIRNWGETRSWQARVTVGGVLIFFVSMLTESVSMLVSAALTVQKTGDELTDIKSNTNGWLYAVMMVVAVALSARTLFTRRAIDQMRVHKLWDALADAAPGAIFGSSRDRRALSERQRGIRLASEAFEVAQRLGPYAEPIDDGRWDQQMADEGLGTDEQAAVYRAAQLQNAIARRDAGLDKISTATVPASPDAEQMLVEITAVARQWTRARRFREQTMTAHRARY